MTARSPTAGLTSDGVKIQRKMETANFLQQKIGKKILQAHFQRKKVENNVHTFTDYTKVLIYNMLGFRNRVKTFTLHSYYIHITFTLPSLYLHKTFIDRSKFVFSA